MKKSYPRDPDWEAMPDVGLEAWPEYSTELAAWAESQAAALRPREAGQLDWDNLAEVILDVARAERRELGYRVSALMASLSRQAQSNTEPTLPDRRLVREQRKLVVMQLETCPSLEKWLSDPRWLSLCWSDAVASLGAIGFRVDHLPEGCPWDNATLLDR